MKSLPNVKHMTIINSSQLFEVSHCKSSRVNVTILIHFLFILYLIVLSENPFILKNNYLYIKSIIFFIQTN
ncbi:hypothetical protein JHK86_003797 [Glycine max]|nr:hypothetical protein JHK86_003797 [Glycine max]